MAAPQRWRSVTALTRQLPSVPRPAASVLSLGRRDPAVRTRLPLDASTLVRLAPSRGKAPQAKRPRTADAPLPPADAAAAQRHAGTMPAAALAEAGGAAAVVQAAVAADCKQLVEAPGRQAEGVRRHVHRPPAQ